MTHSKQPVPLGRIVVTRNALEAIPKPEIFRALDRHRSEDWGDLCENDRLSNEDALADGDRLLSAYQSESGTKFWIITEWDRSVTTVLLPEDY